MQNNAIIWSVLLLAAGIAGAAGAQEHTSLDYAQVRFVTATESSDGLWRFDVTVRHADKGWDHYADAWQVLDPESGEVLAERILLHPHDTEQPFTRSEPRVEIPLLRVLIRARCNVHGFGGHEVLVDLSEGVETEEYRVVKR